MASQDQLAVDDYSSKKELHTTECEDSDVLDKGLLWDIYIHDM